MSSGATIAQRAPASLDILHRVSRASIDKLRIAYSEAQVGWIPYAIERSDYVWEHHDGWMENKENMPVKPSTYYYDRVFGCSAGLPAFIVITSSGRTP